MRLYKIRYAKKKGFRKIYIYESIRLMDVLRNRLSVDTGTFRDVRDPFDLRSRFVCLFVCLRLINKYR